MQHLAQIDFDRLGKEVPGYFNSKTPLTTLFTGYGIAGHYGLISLFLFFGGALLLIYLLWGGLKFMLSGGDPKKVSSAQQIITNALLGLGIIVFAYFIVQAFGVIFGLEGIGNIFK